MTKDLEMALAHLKGKFGMLPDQPDQTMEAKKEMKEGYYGTSNVESYIQAVGYDSFEDFFSDNPGAEYALMNWMEKVPDFREKLMDKGLLEAKKAKEEVDENFIHKMKYRAGIIK